MINAITPFPLLGGAHALPLEPLEDRPGELDVLLDEARGDVAPGGDDGHEGVGRELVEEAGEVRVAHLYHLEVRGILEQLSLNCLMMPEIFSNRCGSRLVSRSAWAITRNVAFSNSSTSSPFMIWRRFSSCFSTFLTLGMSW